MTGDKKEQEYSTFFLAFIGQSVVLTINMLGSMTSDSEHGSITESFPISYEGILLDEDNEHYYLGKTPNEITDFIPKNIVVHGKISDDLDIVNQVLNEMPDPESEQEIN